MKLSDVVSQRPDLVAVEMGDAMVMMDILSGMYYKLVGAGGAIWTLLEKPIEVAALIDILVGEHDIDKATCENETLAYLEELLQRQLIVVNAQ